MPAHLAGRSLVCVVVAGDLPAQERRELHINPSRPGRDEPDRLLGNCLPNLADKKAEFMCMFHSQVARPGKRVIYVQFNPSRS